MSRQGREFDHSPPSNAEVKNQWSYTLHPPTRLHGPDKNNLTLHLFYSFDFITGPKKLKPTLGTAGEEVDYFVYMFHLIVRLEITWNHVGHKMFCVPFSLTKRILEDIEKVTTTSK
jgi:hypothetical protein